MTTDNNYNDPYKELTILLLLGVFAFVAMMLMQGCSLVKYTETKAVKQVAKADHFYPEIVLNYCNRYPLIPTTEYLKGDTIYVYDTVTVDCDTAKAKVVNGVITKIVRVPCPPSTHVTDTVYKTVEDTKKIVQIQFEKSAVERDKAVLTEKVKSLNSYLLWACIIGGLSLLGWIVWVIVKFFK